MSDCMAVNQYKTHHCAELTEQNLNEEVRLAGWVDTIRDHGGVAFVDLRDQHGVTQVVIHDDSLLQNVHRETVVSVHGKVVKRDEETVNPKIPTGTLEVMVDSLEVLGESNPNLPFDIENSTETREDVRLKYRFLDLRNPKVHGNILLRSKIVSFLRRKMESLGFDEINTPILTCSSPEGARDYIIPSRKYEGKFYALPQAPQQFKQLLMVAGFDKYFQIAPPASGTRTREPTGLRANFISWTSRWLSPPRRMCSRWPRRSSTTPLPPSATKRFPQSLSAASRLKRLCSNTAPISRICAIPW